MFSHTNVYIYIYIYIYAYIKKIVIGPKREKYFEIRKVYKEMCIF